MLKVSDSRLLDNCEAAAILNKHVRDLSLPTYEDHDDLDDYEAVELEIDGFVFSIRTYAGFPKGKCGIYFPFVLNAPGRRSIETTSFLIGRIIKELGLSQADLEWQRSDDPSL